MKKLEFNTENVRLLAFIVSKATSGPLSTKLLKDAGWTAQSTASEEWQLSKKSKEEYLFDQFGIIASQGRFDILEYVTQKTVKKDGIYFKTGDKEYKFPRQQLTELKSKLRVVEIPQKKNDKMFNERKLHNSVVFASKNLFKDGHYSQSIFEACKSLNKRVQEISGSSLDGKKLMLDVFSVNEPKIKLNENKTTSDKDEQEGFMHIYSGVMHGIRNPKGHDLINLKDPYKSLEYLSLISLLFKKLDERLK
jgi:uncharacterized protein (TIGR02391 family)